MDGREERKNMSLRLVNCRTSSLGSRDSQSPFPSTSMPLVSPMTNLAMEFSNSSVRTPRRRLSLSSIDSNTPRSPVDVAMSGRQISEESDQGYHTESLSEPVTPLFSPSDGAMTGFNLLPAYAETPKRSVIRKPSTFDAMKTGSSTQEDSKQISVKSDQPSQKDDSVFVHPTIIPRHHSDCEWSTKQLLSPGEYPIPHAIMAPSCPEDDVLLKNEDVTQTAPSGFSDLMEKPLIINCTDLGREEESFSESDIPCHSDFEASSMDPSTRPAAVAVKRSSVDLSPGVGQTKKMRACSLTDELQYVTIPIPESSFTNIDGSPIRRCRSLSFSSPFIDRAFGIGCEDPNLIGDFSKPYALPICGKNKQLKNITGQTLSDLMNGKYAHEIGQYMIIDCRYPYEYHGGHIKGAINIYQKDQLLDFFLGNPIDPPSNGLRLVIVFHCEFSSQRGPSMCDFLRARDRAFHSGRYPQLCYPELYLLSGGYKSFYAGFKDQCDPVGYTQMDDERYAKEMTVFQKKAKSWSGERHSRFNRKKVPIRNL